jgi:glyoxylase-like metal-dependent hydrolase (beta-lactamase superfamily II)
MASVEKLLLREDRIFFPGHGGPVTEPRSFLRGLRTHRRMRERAVLERIRGGDRLIADMVKAIYARTDPRLHGAAALSVLAHLEDLIEKGAVATDGAPSLAGAYRLA